MKNKRLIFLPTLSVTIVILVIWAFYQGILATTETHLESEGLRTEWVTEWQIPIWVWASLGILAYLALNAVAFLFHAALIATAYEALGGQQPSLGTGLRKAWGSRSGVLRWAMMHTIFGLPMIFLARGMRTPSSLQESTEGAPWSIATYFVLPVLLFEVGRVRLAIFKSWTRIRGTWLENIIPHTGMRRLYIGVRFLSILIMGIVLFVLFHMGLGVDFFPLALIIFGGYFVLLGMLVIIYDGINKAALYRIARHSEPSAMFPVWVAKDWDLNIFISEHR